jgi:AraC family transcriptional regulator of adaptative response/methylated-DNA-[protein]-cysteine methyltransferase
MTSNDLARLSTDYLRIEKAIRFLEESYRDQPDLAEVAQNIHLSPYHFQRLFKRWAGISPKQFIQFLTIDYAKQRLAESKSILDTSIEAGLSGPSRLHDLFVTFEAITPGEFKAKGEGLKVSFGFHLTPFGQCLVATTDRGICGLTFVENRGEAQALEDLKKSWPHADFCENTAQTQALVNQIFISAEKRDGVPLNLLLRGTNFQIKVWEALLKIPEGAMVSYHDVAASIGQPTASQAVANAISKNPIGYLIPCHRVIRKMGLVNDYRWGAARKKAILGWEASSRSTPKQLRGTAS